jgi:protein TonB
MAVDPNLETGPDFLRSCLVDSDPALEKRARRVKQRALFISIVVQILIVAAIILFPLLTKGENIAGRVVLLPPVPYAPGGSPNQQRNQTRAQTNRPAVCRFCPPPSIPTNIPTLAPDPGPDPGENIEVGPGIPGVVPGPGVPGSLNATTDRREPPPPDEHRTSTRATPYRVSEPVQSAMLIRRVQPIYPSLAVQIHREGRVELRAIIATDGSIQSLEVISGDPFFVQSALAAVREWRYRPTILNGQPVEVDTHVTVIYTLAH